MILQVGDHHGGMDDSCHVDGTCTANYDQSFNPYIIIILLTAIVLYLSREWLKIMFRLLDLLKMLIAIKLCARKTDPSANWSMLKEWKNRVKRSPDLPFLQLVTADKNATANGANPSLLTFRETDELSDKIASVFYRLLKPKAMNGNESSVDLSSPIRIAVMLPSTPFFVTCFLGLIKAGACAGLINTNLRGKPLAQAIRTALQETTDTGDCTEFPRIFLVHEELLERTNDADVKEVLKELNVKLIVKQDSFDPSKKSTVDANSLDQLLHSHDTTFDVTQTYHTPRWNSPFFYVFTSGTTGGIAKASIIQHIRYILSGYTFSICARLSSNDRVYCALPLYHSSASMIGVCGCILSGACMVIRPKFSASAFAADLCNYECTALQYIGEFARYTLAAKYSKAEETLRAKQLETSSRLFPQLIGSNKWKGVRVAFGNGMRPEIWEEFQKRFGIAETVEFYASTEGNANMINNCGKVGCLGVIPNFVLPLYPICLVKCDPLTGDILRDPKTKLAMKCKANEPGQLLGLIRKNINSGKVTDPSRMFEGYTDAKASKKKVVNHVMNHNDEWFATGDLLQKDWFGFYFWVDRIGDTFRWKGENVSTCEVSAAFLSEKDEGGSISDVIFDTNVYGVEIPGYPGRAGMARITLAEGKVIDDLDFEKLYSLLEGQLAPYARPVFLRFAKPQDGGHSTSTFKHIKASLRNQGFEPANCEGEAIYMRDDASKSFRIFTKSLHDDVCNSKVRL